MTDLQNDKNETRLPPSFRNSTVVPLRAASAVVSANELKHATEKNRRKAAQKNPSENEADDPIHRAFLCFLAAFKSMRLRKQIELELMERIFDRAEEISLDAETPTPATTLIRDCWDRLVG